MAIDNLDEMTLEECEKMLNDLLDSGEANGKDLVGLYTAMGDKSKEDMDFEKSKECYMSALSKALEEYGESSIQAGDAALNAGNGLFNVSDYGTALKYYGDALAAYEKAAPDDTDKIVEVRRSMGDCHSGSQNYEEAVNSYQKAIDFLKTKKGEGDPAFYLLFTSMGATLSEMGRFEDALGYFRKGFDLKKNFVGSEMDLMDDYENIGKCCEKVGRYDEGIEAFSKIVAAIKETMPEMDFLAQEYQGYIDSMKEARSKQ